MILSIIKWALGTVFVLGVICVLGSIWAPEYSELSNNMAGTGALLIFVSLAVGIGITIHELN